MIRNSILVFFILVSFDTLGQYVAETKEQALRKEKAKWIFVYSKAPGFISAKSANGTTGICIEVMKYFESYVERNYAKILKQNIGLKTRFVHLIFKWVKDSKGAVFGFNITTIIKERQQIYNMSPAYINNIGMLIINSSVPALQNLTDISVKFKSMKAVTVKNTTNEIWLKWIKSNYYPDMLIEYQNDIFRRSKFHWCSLHLLFWGDSRERFNKEMPLWQ